MGDLFVIFREKRLVPSCFRCEALETSYLVIVKVVGR